MKIETGRLELKNGKLNKNQVLP